jgi:hypothetical protein
MSIAFIDLAAQQRRIRDRLDAAIGRVLDHGGYVMGPEVRQFEAELAAFGEEIGDEGGGLAGEAFDLDPLGAAGAARGADEEGTLGAELVEGGVGPGGGHGGEDADLAAPALEEHFVDGARAGERGLDDGAGFEIHGVGLGVAVEELVEPEPRTPTEKVGAAVEGAGASTRRRTTTRSRGR